MVLWLAKEDSLLHQASPDFASAPGDSSNRYCSKKKYKFKTKVLNKKLWLYLKQASKGQLYSEKKNNEAKQATKHNKQKKAEAVDTVQGT